MTLHTNFITRLAVILVLLGVVMAISTPQVSAQVDIPDAGLKAAINHALNQQLGGARDPGDSVTPGDMTNAAFTSLDASGRNISNLRGLASAPQLTYLDLSDNDLTDTLTETTALGKTFLKEPTPGASKLWPIRQLVNLETLDISDNNIAVIRALRNLTNLRTLKLQGNSIANFDAILNLAIMPAITSTNADGTIEWGTGARGGTATGLSRGAEVWVEEITSQGTLLTNRFSVQFFDTYLPVLIKTMGVTVHAAHGEALHIPDESLKFLFRLLTPTFSQFVAKPYVEGLRALDATSGREIPYIVRAAGVESSRTHYVDVQYLEGLEHCRNLETLILDDSFLGDSAWPIIGQLTRLKTLSLENVGIDDSVDSEGRILRFLDNLTELRDLNLSDNFIANPQPIVNLTKLEELDLRNNDISYIPSGFKNLANLEVLLLAGNTLAQRRDSGSGLSTQIAGYYDPGPADATYPMAEILQHLANRPNQRLLCDIPIVKSIEFLEPHFAYGPDSLIHVRVTFNSDVGYTSSSGAFRGGAPYLTLSLDGQILRDAETNPYHTADWFDDGSAVSYMLYNPNKVVPGGYQPINRPPPPIDPRTGEEFQEPFKKRDDNNDGIPDDPSDTRPTAGGRPDAYVVDNLGNRVLTNPYYYFANLAEPLAPEVFVSLGDTLEFAYFVPPEVTSASGIRVEELSASPLVHFGPAADGLTAPPRHQAWLMGRSWFRDSPQPTKPIITTSPTVALRRADGGTGAVTGDFDVEITFSAPLSEESAAALADQVTLGGVDGASITSLTRPGPPTAYESETWTLSVSALGLDGDVTVTLDPAGLEDVAFPGNPVTPEGSTLSVTVPVSAPSTQFTPRETPYVLGDALEISIRFAEDGVTYEGGDDVPPYITIYLGERVQANERHATWARAEDANSTLVTFAYEIAPTDFASSVSIKSEAGVVVPQGATLVLGDERIVGTAPLPVASGETPPASVAQQESVIPLGTPSARATATEFDVQIVGVVLLPGTETETEPKADASGVPRTPVVFNELGNGSGDTNDWLEFRNVTGSDVSLKDWELSVVQDGKKEDTSLVVFPDVSVPANGLLLIVNTSPSETLLARGDDAAASGEKNGGSASPYLVNAGLSLPDDGKFLLILRNAKEKLGKNEAFVDVAGGGGSGTDAFVRETAGDYDTHVWPLQIREAPGGNTEDALGSGKVWQRAKANIVGYHKDAWAEAAFTGIGYDRKVSQSAATAGTPGYPNGAVKVGSDTPKGSITFSEIMFDSGGGTLPQWIEVYNRSKTEAINIDRWKLEIQNVDSEDLVGRPIVTLTLQEKVIQPNQTLLIVAGDARASSGTRLPSDRVYNLLTLHEKNLRIKTARDTFLSAEGFYLKLTDRNGTKIDEVGNIAGDRRRQDAPDWILAMSREEGVRSSLIRRYTKGTSDAADGMQRGSWVLASHVKRFVAGSEALHWGDAEDIGTPGYRKGGALPVELSSFSVKREEKGSVVLTWTTESEVDNAGFNLRRSEKRGSGFALINPALIAGAGTTGERQTYTFTDTSAKPGVDYYYQIEEVSFGGKPETLVTRLLPGPVSASNRALVTFGELKQRE